MRPVEPPSASFDVSVVIPLFNKAKFIAEALASALAQSHPPREILVVDDASTDDGPSIVRSFEASSVRLIAQSNQGPGQARNRGIAEAQGEWVAFLDADDLWLDDHLAELGRLHHRHFDVPILSTSYREVAETVSKERGDADATGRFDFFELPWQQRTMYSSSVAVATNILRAASGFASFWPGEDIDLWVRLGLEYPVAVSHRVTALYRRDTGGLTEQYLSEERAFALPFLDHLDRALLDDRYRDRHGLIEKYRARWYHLLTRQALRFGDGSSARFHLSRLPSSARFFPLRAMALIPSPFLQLGWKLHSILKR